MRTPRTDESISESTRERREKLLGAALRRVSVRCVLSDWDDMCSKVCDAPPRSESQQARNPQTITTQRRGYSKTLS
jgi:hypothetical protein